MSNLSQVFLIAVTAALCCTARADQLLPDKTFYTIMTPDGPMQVEMPVPSRRSQAAVVTQSAVANENDSKGSSVSDVAKAYPNQKAILLDSTNTRPAKSDKDQDNQSHKTVYAGSKSNARVVPFEEFDGQQYVDTVYLEQREFNLEGKKRFYSVPDGLGGNQVIERESGVRLSNFTPQSERASSVSLSDGYRRVAPNILMQLTNQQCLSAAQLKSAKMMTEKPVDFWPIPSFKPKFEFLLAELTQEIRNIHLMSYTSTTRRPSYYWPLPIFLDQSGCMLEGVAGFFQSKTAATWLQNAALQGNLVVPTAARYLLLTPLIEAAELSGETLADRGQLRLTPLPAATP